MKRRSFVIASILGLLSALVPSFVRNWFAPKTGWFRAKFTSASKPYYPEFGFVVMHRRPEKAALACGGERRAKIKKAIQFGSDTSLHPPLSDTEVEEISTRLFYCNNPLAFRGFMSTPEFQSRYRINEREAEKNRLKSFSA